MYNLTKMTMPLSHKDNLRLDRLKFVLDQPQYQKQTFELKGQGFASKTNKRMQFIINEASSTLTIRGSIPFLVHANLTTDFTLKDFQAGIKFLEDLLGIDLSGALVKELEFFVLVPLNYDFRQLLYHHRSIEKMHTHSYPSGKYFDSTSRQVKLYNPKKVGGLEKHMTNINNLIYYSIHYKASHPFLRNKSVTLSQLSDQKTIEQYQNDLISTYRSICKTGQVRTDLNKELLSSGVIPLIVLKELEKEVPDFDAKHRIWDKIKVLEGLSPVNKSDRRRVIKNWFERISDEENDPFDISNEIIDQLKFINQMGSQKEDMEEHAIINKVRDNLNLLLKR